MFLRALRSLGGVFLFLVVAMFLPAGNITWTKGWTFLFRPCGEVGVDAPVEDLLKSTTILHPSSTSSAAAILLCHLGPCFIIRADRPPDCRKSSSSGGQQATQFDILPFGLPLGHHAPC